ncbi:MAG TPA: flagellar biosynthetic protein FliO [Burkholderiaceae bacterium]
MSVTASTSLPLLQMIIALAAVLGAILALAWAARRVQRGGSRGGRVLRTHASLALGTRERAVLVEAAGQFLLLGVAAGRVSLLHRYDAAPELPTHVEQPASGADFLTALRQALGKNK